MSKLRYNDKINIYKDKKKGLSYKTISLKYKTQDNHIKYIVRLIDKHGYSILKKKRNNKYSIIEKERIINRVLLNNESVFSVSIDEGLLSDSMLFNWIKNYKEMGYNIVERKRGRSPTIMKKPKQLNKNETKEEQIKRLEEENLYLKAELEYSKKLRAVVQARKNHQQKKK